MARGGMKSFALVQVTDTIPSKALIDAIRRHQEPRSGRYYLLRVRLALWPLW